MFGLGNDRCPICLTGFTEADVREGKVVTLEHVPAKALDAEGRAMCLTCSDCNNSSGRVEKLAAEMDRAPTHGWKAKLTMGKGGIPPQTVYVTGDGPIENIREYLDVGKTGPINVRSKGLRVPEDDFLKALRLPDQTTQMQYAFDPRYASVAWLKAAYLSVFSLLGQHGYRYAQGEAIEQVRRQIMEPSKEILGPFHLPVPPEWKYGSCIVVSRRERPCWAVKMKDRFVLLPRSWDTPFYEWIVESAVDGEVEITLGGGPLWYPQRFGYIPAGSISLREDADFLKRNDTFGERVALENARDVTFVCVDRTAQHITVLPVPRD